MSQRVYYTKAIAANNYVNNGGTVVYGGNVPANAPITNVPTCAQVLGAHSGKNGSVVPGPGATAGTAQVDTNGTWAVMTAGSYVMRRYCSSLAGVSYTGLNSGGNAAGAHHSIHWVGSKRTTPITSWDYASGAATAGSATSDNFIMDVTGTDNAAVPTRALPGELAYMVTGATPTQADYAARTQW
jgi:hypothetical protein